MRDSEDDGSLEILLLKRTEQARFMPGVWVFPGGALDTGDGEGEAGLVNCARRELAEEAGVELHPEAELVPPPDVGRERIRQALERIADDMMVDITLDGGSKRD